MGNYSPMVQSRKSQAAANLSKVDKTLKEMKKHIPNEKITVPAVAKKANLSPSTIYRNENMLNLITEINPEAIRRPKNLVEKNELTILRQEYDNLQRKYNQVLKQLTNARDEGRQDKRLLENLKDLNKQYANALNLAIHRDASMFNKLFKGIPFPGREQK